MDSIVKTDEPVEESLKLESHYLLRLPPNVAKSVNKVLGKKPKKIKKYMRLDMNPETKLGTVIFNKHVVAIKLIDLPCVIESLKTIDRKIFFKTADIHQMMLWYDPSNVVVDEKKNKEFVSAHGITPPMKNVRKNRWRKTMKNKKPLDGPEIEKEVKWLLKMDNEATSVRWELVEDDKKVDNNVNNGIDSDALDAIDEKDVFGEMTDSLTEDEYDDYEQDFPDEADEA